MALIGQINHNKLLNNIFNNIEQQNVFIELIQLNILTIEKIFILSNISIEKIYEIAIKLNLRNLYDYGILNFIKSENNILDMCIEYSNLDIFLLAKNKFFESPSETFRKAIKYGSENIIQNIIDQNNNNDEILLSYLLELIKEKDTFIVKRPIEQIIRQLNWNNITNSNYIIILLIKSELLEILIIANGLGLILNENCLIESIKISNLGIINWILNKGIKIVHKFTWDFSNSKCSGDIINLLKIYSHTIENIQNNQTCDIYHNLNN